jgi:hypothetical protein
MPSEEDLTLLSADIEHVWDDYYQKNGPTAWFDREMIRRAKERVYASVRLEG